MSEASKLREMSVEQLSFQLKETQQDLFRLRFQAASEKLDAPSNLKKLRRQIARIHTILHQKSAGAGA
jgi:large subunit ribosomal protein L29